MTDKTVDQMAAEINKTYYDPEPDDWTSRLPLDQNHKQQL